MSSEDLERLERWFDGELSPEEAEAVEARLTEDGAWREALADLEAERTLLRRHVEAGIEAADFGRLWEAVAAHLPEPASPASARPALATEPQPGLGERLRAWWQAHWAPLLVGAGVGAALILWVRPVSQQSEAPAPPIAQSPGSVPSRTVAEGPREVRVHGVQNDGNKTVLISLPDTEGGSTVIWLLDTPDAGGAREEDPI